MLVFLSWSGSRSKAVAETFSKWIVQVIQAVEPWISSDIEKGARWNSEVAARLEQSRVGIICLTKENLDAKWILFESGALSKPTMLMYAPCSSISLRPTLNSHLGSFNTRLATKTTFDTFLGPSIARFKRMGTKHLLTLYWIMCSRPIGRNYQKRSIR